MCGSLFGQGSPPEQQEKCKKASNVCYALWREDANGTSILGQGEYSSVLCSLQTLVAGFMSGIVDIADT
jgi:hypothetical protein